MRILQLSPQVANQIAAGEVIERPASVVKELLENAQDAGATAIDIVIEYGGFSRIKVSDDGHGIVNDDLPLAVLAHATSKIANLNDLYTVSSMGFRGEALASIASVSKLSISSRPAGQKDAALLRVTDKGLDVSPTARNQGTTVEVQDLFYNAPVRKKFLKNERTEYQALEMVVKRFALCKPDMAITLTHNGKQTLALPPSSNEKTRQERIKKILGKAFVDEAIYLRIERGDMCLEGWVGSLNYHRSQNDRQWIYVNQRMVKDKLLNHALKQSYEDRLPPGRFPGCLLYLYLPPDTLDVNVHPTKHEVRFEQPRLVHDLIVSELSDALSQPVMDEVYDIIPTSAPKKAQTVREYDAAPLLFSDACESESTNELVLLQSNFAIIIYHNEPYLVDLKKLQQQGLIHKLNQQTMPFKRRPLLVPVSYTSSCPAEWLLDNYQSILQDFGIDIDMIADNKLIIRTIPVLLPQLDIQRFMSGLINSTDLAPNALLALLADCQTLSEPPLTLEDKNAFISYMQMLLSDSTPQKSWCRLMNNATCQALLHG